MPWNLLAGTSRWQGLRLFVTTPGIGTVGGVRGGRDEKQRLSPGIGNTFRANLSLIGFSLLFVQLHQGFPPGWAPCPPDFPPERAGSLLYASRPPPHLIIVK